MSLKDLTWENHSKAERKKFAKLLMSGSIDPNIYYMYITNQHYMYFALESKIHDQELKDIKRANYILEDIQELEKNFNVKEQYARILPVSVDYCHHLETLDYTGLISHLYVRHFGDMFGGQMISKKIPGSGKMYEFENKQALITKVRSMLNEDMADEANCCFAYAIRLFNELENEFDLE